MHAALTIAGSDPSGGAGIQGDLKTFHGHGVYGLAVVTALTVQNTRGVTGVFDVPPDFVARQLEAVLSDIRVGAAKTGMLSVVATIEAVASVLERRPLDHLVVDPVMVATSGDALLRDDAVATLVARLVPLASVLTPNLPEAERLLGRRIGGADELADAAADLCGLGAAAVLLKGGHLEGPEVIDVLHVAGGEHVEFRDARIDTTCTHGTGCALAAGIAAGLAKGDALPAAVGRAREFVRRGLAAARPIGGGTSPLDHLAAGA